MRKEHTSVELVDDIDGSPATTTIEFSVGGKNYSIDLSDQHADEFNKALAPYIEHARHAPTNKRKARKSRSSSEASRIKRQKSAQIRAWALEKGITVAKRGMLNQSVIDAYEAAHVAQNTDIATDDQ